MGVDIYMGWDNIDEKDKKSQITGFCNAGEAGYLRGAYFGGLSDVLHELFDWMDWENQPEDGVPFNPAAFEMKLALLRTQGGKRPGSGTLDYMKDAQRGFSSFYERQEEPIGDESFAEYDAFLELGKRLTKEGKNPKVMISY